MRFTVQPLDGGEPVVLHDSTNAHQVGMWLAQEGVEGWFGTPAIREEPTERAMTDGDMSPATLTQGARTITLHGIAAAPSTVEAARLMDLVNGLAGRELAVIGEDAHGAREVRGFLSDDPLPQLLHGEDAFTFDVTVTCPDPHKYGMEVAYPASGETVAVTNVGNCATWPRVHVEGHVESLVMSLAGRTVSWTGNVSSLDIDFSTGEASGGTISVDNAFPIPPGDHEVYARALPSGSRVTVYARPCWR